MDMESMMHEMERLVSAKRLAHCLGTRDCAVAMAKRFGADQQKAALAGLVHDCAKSLDRQDMIDYARRSEFPVDELLLEFPPVLHAAAGSVLAAERFGIADPEVLSAICWHALPRKNMSLLDKIIYVADLVEPGRQFPGVEELRALALTDLDEAYRLGMARTMIYVLEKGQPLHEATLREYNRLSIERARRAEIDKIPVNRENEVSTFQGGNL